MTATGQIHMSLDRRWSALARRLRQDRRRRSRTSSRITSAARRTQRHL